MSDKMTGIPFDKLLIWAMTEYAQEKSIFGVSYNKFFTKSNHNTLTLFNRTLETPLGPAAGPNTQLAQNIIASYIAGCRFFELKTVQLIDGEDLPVAKPCILAKDEGYNVEWSTELTVPEALNEYIKAWFALKLLSKELSLGSIDGFIFNMSVGYDLEGIKSPKINTFINSLVDASQTVIWKECKAFLLEHLSLFTRINEEYMDGISPKICNSITLSTLHGCPPEEIERIASYLLKEKKLHTYIKCNPTLLGYDFARSTLDQMGYKYLVFDDHHFKNDLQYEEAVPMIARLGEFAKEQGLSFGVKLTNTFPVKIVNHELPGEEMYLSGRALYPLTIHLAYRLAKEFDGNIRISYSGGADYFNIDKIYETGIWPITLATTILKPGGYLRLRQLADRLENGYRGPEYTGVDVRKLEVLAEEAVSDVNYLKYSRDIRSSKEDRKVPLIDCFTAPCKYECPIGQDIPQYIRLVGEKRFSEALEVITAKNPLPFITGTLCNHRCMTGCTRQYYEESVEIRKLKLLAAQNGYKEFMSKQKTPEINSDFRVAAIGGGPAGLSGAYFLAKNGVDVTVFEKRKEIGGIIQHVAPAFRISREAIQQDMELIRQMGVKFRLGVDPNVRIEDLKREGFKYIFIAIGAWKPGTLPINDCDREIRNVLEFLEAYNSTPELLQLGKTVAVVGAGNSAMDAARAAIRVSGVEKVYIIYRRTKQYIPADKEELSLALQEGVELKELLTPVIYINGVLRCQRMELGASDTSGRRSPAVIPGEFIDLPVDSVIAAVGEQVESEFFVNNGIALDAKGKIWVNPTTNETSVEQVFIGGDTLRGPATIVEGIADGIKFARIVLERERGQHLVLNQIVAFNTETQLEDIRNKKGVLQKAGLLSEEHNRCFECHKVCNLCVEVCPNRANIAVAVPTKRVDYNSVKLIGSLTNNKVAVPMTHDDCSYLNSISSFQHKNEAVPIAQCDNSTLNSISSLPDINVIIPTAKFNCSNQVIHMDGLCNECGNCEAFCPYDSAPYKDKLTLYWSQEAFKESSNPGFLLLDKEAIRFKVRLDHNVKEVTFDPSGNCSDDIPKEIAAVIWTLVERYSFLFL